MTIVKNEFRISMKFYYVTSIFDQHIFDNETTVFLIFFRFAQKCILLHYFF